MNDEGENEETDEPLSFASSASSSFESSTSTTQNRSRRRNSNNLFKKTFRRLPPTRTFSSVSQPANANESNLATNVFSNWFQDLRNSIPNIFNTTSHRVVHSAVIDELRQCVRLNDPDQLFLTDAELSRLSLLLSFASNSSSSTSEVVLSNRHRLIDELFDTTKEWVFRQIRRCYSPRQTEQYVKHLFQDTLKYTFWFTVWTVAACTVCQFSDLTLQYDGVDNNAFTTTTITQSITPTTMQWLCTMALRFSCFFVRLSMTIHLTYCTGQWLHSLFFWISWNIQRTWSGLRFAIIHFPPFVLELFGVLFEVFIGWQLFFSALLVFTLLYIVPLVVPLASATRLPFEWYEYFFQQPVPWSIRWISLLLG